MPSAVLADDAVAPGGIERLRLLLLNPNTSSATTDMMVRIARQSADANVDIAGLTAAVGPSLITNETELAIAADGIRLSVAALGEPKPDGIIIAAFGDPGLAAARAIAGCDVVGIAEAAMREAALNARPFSVVTTTPHLASAIRKRAEHYGHGDSLLSVRITEGDVFRTMADARGLLDALEATARRAIDEDGAQAIVVGGGPLADAARDLSERIGIPVIEPIPAALRLITQRRSAAS
ncbi:aspartate/glutamate racemase family protein [Rhizobium sp. S152]|uniref:aspartate/glutamate racemase family protein n=1 Tax=Rhizobium sp. S152 TaxID=3055038 RepID=UPI0025A98F29|nr:aspartate/glutamate racemase family protein [Rhizobium sp. S152]MDM9624680.1 aspartate/glutamate racemase family protein [Rhizobium sp. S152]